jgi:Flp pilus assembly protein TadG
MGHGERRAARRRGTALIEMALTAPIFFLLFIGVLDFGRVYYTAMTVTHAARAGAQYGAQNDITSTDIPGMKQAALDAANDVSGVTADARLFCKCASGATVDCIVDTCPEGVQQVYVEVTVSKTFTTLFPYPGIPTTTNLTRQARIRVQ